VSLSEPSAASVPAEKPPEVPAAEATKPEEKKKAEPAETVKPEEKKEELKPAPKKRKKK